MEEVNREKLLIPVRKIKIAEIKDHWKIFCGDKMGQIWQFNANTLQRESVGKVTGNILKMVVESKSETLTVMTSSHQIVQLILGEKKMRKKIGLNIKKGNSIPWKIEEFSSFGLGFISEKNLITFVNLKKKKVDKLTCSQWFGKNSELVDFSIDQENHLMYLFSNDNRLIVLENRNYLKSMHQNDWIVLEDVQMVEQLDTKEYEFFENNTESQHGFKILKSFDKKVFLKNALKGKLVQFTLHKKKEKLLRSKSNTHICHITPYILEINQDKKSLMIQSSTKIIDFECKHSRLLIHRWEEVIILDQQTISNLFHNKRDTIELNDIVEDLHGSMNNNSLKTNKQLSWVLDLENDYNQLGLTGLGFVTLDSGNRLKLFDLRGKLRDEVRIDCKSKFDVLIMEVNDDTLLIKFNFNSFKIFKIQEYSLKLHLGGINLQGIKDGLINSYPYTKWTLQSYRFNQKLDKLGCLFSSNDQKHVITVLDLRECNLGIIELQIDPNQLPNELLFDEKDDSIFGVRISSKANTDSVTKSESTVFKIFMINLDGKIKKLDSIDINERIVKLEYPCVFLQNSEWKGIGIMEDQTIRVSEEIRNKCVEFSKAITNDKVDRALELAEDLEQRIEGRVLNKMMILCLQKENADLAEFTLNKMKFLRGKMLLSKSKFIF